MNVYADLRWPPKTGIGVVQAEILSRVPPGITIVDLKIAARIGSPLSPLHIGRALAKQGMRGGVFWSPGYMPPLPSRIPAVVTVHDLTHLHFYTRLHAAYYGAVLKHLYRRCRAVICVSAYTREEFLQWSGMPSERVFAVHNGVSQERFSRGETYGLPFPYVLYPGNRRGYKNVDRLVKAYSVSALPGAGIRLVLTGAADGRLLRLASESGVERLMHFAGDLDGADLARLYRGATLTAFVSLYEGFGLPIIEAMAAGVPVLTSDRAAMPEVAGNAALLVDPTSVAQITAGLERLAFDEPTRQRLVQAGRIQASCFNWDTSAARVWEIVTAAAG